eukprot:TRINITY_DN21993_c0_g1_i2.p1 TRINITY_DN21993_c0_g1~~TRINITY_DN21993_c0_g1_i2.p1  ORF type:complete len:556 (-),score=94.01 TRINITY_DN21993_c0_g1_i2:8-1675(-)
MSVALLGAQEKAATSRCHELQRALFSPAASSAFSPAFEAEIDSLRRREEQQDVIFAERSRVLRALEISVQQQNEIVLQRREELGRRKHEAAISEHQRTFSSSSANRIQHLTSALTFIKERTAVVEAHLKEARTKLQHVEIEELGLEDEKSRGFDSSTMCDEVQRQSREIEGLRELLEGQRGHDATVQREIHNAIAALEPLRNEEGKLKATVVNLQQHLHELRTFASFESTEGKTLPERVLRSQASLFRIEECMKLLKSAVINVDVDYRFIGQIRDKANRFHDKEHIFKEAHNEVKVAVISVAGNKRAIPGERWPLNPEEVNSCLEEYRARTVFKSLQEMVICYDMMNEATKANLLTADEIVQNADLLYALARHTLRLENKKIEAARLRAKTSESRLTQPFEKVRRKPDASSDPLLPPSPVSAGVYNSPPHPRRVGTVLRGTPPDLRTTRPSSAVPESEEEETSRALSFPSGSPPLSPATSRQSSPQRSASRSSTPPPDLRSNWVVREVPPEEAELASVRCQSPTGRRSPEPQDLIATSPGRQGSPHFPVAGLTSL